MPSQVNYYGSYVTISDGDICLLLNIMLQVLSTHTNDEWDSRVSERWENTLKNYPGFGCYELDLEKLVTTSIEKERMLRVLDETMEAFRLHGASLKKEWLNSLFNG